MRALSIWQPWASLLACGFKAYETRGWIASDSIVGRRLGICSTRVLRSEQRLGDQSLRERFFMKGFPPIEELPNGALLGFATLATCHVVDQAFVDRLAPIEYELGFYALGRFAWRFVDHLPLPSPIPVRGSQGIWSLPDDIVAAAQSQVEARAREAGAAHGRDLHDALG